MTLDVAPNLLRLETINVAGCDLSGTLPKWLTQVSSLQEIYTDGNAKLERGEALHRDNYAAREAELEEERQRNEVKRREGEEAEDHRSGRARER